MRRRLAQHLLAVAIVLSAFVEIPEPVSEVRAADPTPHPVVSSLEPVILEDDLFRTALSTRTSQPTSSPLPTPVPIDPTRTPIPAPTPPPAPPSLIFPVHGVISQYWSPAHPAVDIAAPCGTPVIAPASGTVVYAGWKNNGGGNVIDIDTGWSTVSLNHLSSIAVSSGWVQQGTVVGYVGATGWATGCHVHVGLLVDGGWSNLIAFLP